MTVEAPWSDDPIESAERDRFGRSPFARLVAQAVDGIPLGSSSTVFGLVGRWGSGKSSVAAMVSEFLPETWIVQRFTPWAASGIAGLQLEFVAALDAALGGVRAEDQAAREALKKYVRWARPLLAAVPGVGSALAASADVAADEVIRRKPWSAEFDEMTSSLADINRRVLIVCDDIDRLDAVELLEFLKVVRLLGRFPNVHYLVAYDADTVEDLLASEGISGRTGSFMEKIVQHPFELPQLDRATRWDHIRDAVDQVIEEQRVRLDDAGMERYRLLIDTLAIGLNTPRQIARYEQHLRTLANLVPGEVDVLDFAALAFLRLNHHEVYEVLPAWATELQKGLASASGDEAKGLTKDEWIERITRASRRADVAGALETITFLFPALRSERSVPLHQQAFANQLYMERYYSLGVPENDVSDVKVSKALSSLLGGKPEVAAEREISALLESAHPSVARLAVDKLRAHRARTLSPTDKVTPLVKFILRHHTQHLPSREQPDSPADALFHWLADETLRGYSSSEFDRATLLELFGDEMSLGLLLRISAPFGSKSDSSISKMLADFAQYVAEQISQPGADSLEPIGYLRLKLSLLQRVNSDTSIEEILDDKVDGDVAAFESVAIAMVQTEHWFNGRTTRPELSFDGALWRTAISEVVRRRMTPELGPVLDDVFVDADDVSDENRRRYAIVAAQSDLKTLASETA